MAVVIRMMRAGAKKRPFYRIVVADSRRQRDGRFVEILGYYDPMAKPWAVKMDEEKVKGWIAQGAQPSTQAASIFRRVGIIAARPSKSPKKAATASAAAGSAKKKTAVKRARPRKVTERKTRAKATRAKKKAAKKTAVAAKA
jgi:small subunit ribosomal protein S16